MRGIDDLDVTGKTVIVRADLNVPMKDGVITDDGRIRASLPTITALAQRGAKVVVCSHLGRPKGEADPKYSLAPVGDRLCELLAQQVHFAGDGTTDIAGATAESTVAPLADGEVALLENLRYSAAETSKDASERGVFADALAALAGPDGLYVGDGFGAVHRKHASVYELPARMPHAAGMLVMAEVEVLQRLTSPDRPYAVVLGGSKVSDKLGVIDSLLDTADKLLIGGGMVFTFLKAQGHEVGKSLLETDQLETVRGYLERAAQRGVEILLPVDIVAATDFAPDAGAMIVDADKIPADRLGLDIGPESGKQFAAALSDCRTIFWNGPMGVFEMEKFAEGTRAVAQALTESHGLTVVGGGDSAAAVRSLGFADNQFGHISTGGGASLEYLEGKTLPGLQALAAESRGDR